MNDAAETRVTGTITDRLVRIHPVPMSLDFTAVGDHALAHGWPELRHGAPAPDLRHRETWHRRFQFLSDDGRIDVVASGLTPILGLRFLVPWGLVFGHPVDRAEVTEQERSAPTRLRH